MPRICPSPTAVGIGEVDLYAVYRLSLVLLLGLEDELLEDGVVSGDNGDRDDFTPGIALTPTLDTEPVTTVIDCMRRAFKSVLILGVLCNFSEE